METVRSDHVADFVMGAFVTILVPDPVRLTIVGF